MLNGQQSQAQGSFSPGANFNGDAGGFGGEDQGDLPQGFALPGFGAAGQQGAGQQHQGRANFANQGYNNRFAGNQGGQFQQQFPSRTSGPVHDIMGRINQQRAMEARQQQQFQPDGFPQQLDPSDPRSQQFMQGLMGELQQSKRQMGSYKGMIDQLSQQNQMNSEVINKMRGIFAPEQEGGESDPYQEQIDDMQNQLDFYLEQALVAARMGRDIPLTTNLAIKSFQNDIKHLQYQRESQKKLSMMEARMKQLTDPSYMVDQQTYSAIDNVLIDAIERIYGPGKQSYPAKLGQYNAIASQISNYLTNMREQDPQSWDLIRRNGNYQKSLVNQFIESNLPPKALEILNMDRIQRTPMDKRQLWDAHSQARQIQDQKTREQLTKEIRYKIWEQKFGAQNTQPMSRLYA